MAPSNTLAEMVLEISTSVDRSGRLGDQAAASELKQVFEPGLEIRLNYGGYLATGSVLWVAHLPAGVRAGVRLCALSMPSGLQGKLEK
jgi:hypothetical protein